MKFRTRDDGSVYPIKSPDFESNKYANYTKPSKCRSCGRPVYYFQSQYGGKVFFDDLGHPWPKHECGFSYKGSVSSLQRLDWIQKGYRPISIHKESIENMFIKCRFLNYIGGISYERYLWISNSDYKSLRKIMKKSFSPMMIKVSENKWNAKLSTFLLVNESVCPLEISAVVLPKEFDSNVIKELSRNKSFIKKMSCISINNFGLSHISKYIG